MYRYNEAFTVACTAGDGGFDVPQYILAPGSRQPRNSAAGGNNNGGNAGSSSNGNVGNIGNGGDASSEMKTPVKQSASADPLDSMSSISGALPPTAGAYHLLTIVQSLYKSSTQLFYLLLPLKRSR